ncbi:MAG: acyl carrier protein [Opitutaceae bacterium]
MTTEQIEQKVREILAAKLSKPLEQISPESRLVEDLGADSFGALEVMFEVEETFGLSIADTDVERVGSVKDIVAYVVEQQSKPNLPEEAAGAIPPPGPA